MDRRAFGEGGHTPEAALTEHDRHGLVDLLRHCAEVMRTFEPSPEDKSPQGTDIDHGHLAAFENAVGLLHAHGLAGPPLAEEKSPYAGTRL
ncbi:MAG: hypothetical protein AAFY03_02555, partial [Pseudomonadota bacterium]